MPSLHRPRGLGSRELTLHLPSSALGISKHLPLQEDSQQSNQQMLLIRTLFWQLVVKPLPVHHRFGANSMGAQSVRVSLFGDIRLIVSPCPCPTQEFPSPALPPPTALTPSRTISQRMGGEQQPLS